VCGVPKILSVLFSENNMKETVEWTNDRMEKSLSTFIVTANPEIVMRARRDTYFQEVLSSADIITPDGIGIVYASKILGHSLEERVAGYDMLHALLEYRETTKALTKIFLLGSSPEVVKSASKKLEELYGCVQISGFHHGFFKKKSVEETSIVEMISREKPDLLLVGLGSPKQEDFIHRFKEKLRASVMIGVGGSFDILSGRICRAPVIIRRLGFEWLYRLICQPRRIKRQIIIPVFVCLVLIQRIARRSAAEVTTSE